MPTQRIYLAGLFNHANKKTDHQLAGFLQKIIYPNQILRRSDRTRRSSHKLDASNPSV